MNMEDFNIDMNFEDFNIDVNLGDVDSNIDKRIHKPKKIKSIRQRQICYDNALKLAKEIEIKQNERVFTFISGNFVFGDFIEAFCEVNDLFIREMTISTLSLSEENVDSLRNLLENKFVNKLNLIVSDYFFGHERHKLIPYIYRELDIDNRFQMAVAREHTKICIFETYNGMKYVFHGSANLRSSDNIEQVDLEENSTLYDYIFEFHEKIIYLYKTINKTIGGKELWQQLQEKEDQVDVEVQQRQEEADSVSDATEHRFNKPTF